MSMVYERNYQRLVKVIGAFENKTLTAPGFMDLHVDVLGCRGPAGTLDIALSHNYIQNGDVMADPDMEIRIIPSMGMCEALTFQQDGLPFGCGTAFKRVYEDGEVYPQVKKELNAFLETWTKNLIEQGFTPENIKREEVAA